MFGSKRVCGRCRWKNICGRICFLYRDEILDEVNGFYCNDANGGDFVNYDLANENALNTLESSTADEKKIVIMSFCQANNDDDNVKHQWILILIMQSKWLL